MNNVVSIIAGCCTILNFINSPYKGENLEAQTTMNTVANSSYMMQLLTINESAMQWTLQKRNQYNIFTSDTQSVNEFQLRYKL